MKKITLALIITHSCSCLYGEGFTEKVQNLNNSRIASLIKGAGSLVSGALTVSMLPVLLDKFSEDFNNNRKTNSIVHIIWLGSSLYMIRQFWLNCEPYYLKHAFGADIAEIPSTVETGKEIK